MFEELSRDERLLLLRVLCSFAWADLDVTDSERRFVQRVVAQMKLDGADAKQAEEWLDVAPPPGSVNVGAVALAHRRVFFEAVRALVYVDGKLDPEEASSLEKLGQGLGLT